MQVKGEKATTDQNEPLCIFPAIPLSPHSTEKNTTMDKLLVVINFSSALHFSLHPSFTKMLLDCYSASKERTFCAQIFLSMLVWCLSQTNQIFFTGFLFSFVEGTYY